MKRRGFIAGIGVAVAGLFLPRIAHSKEGESRITVLSNELKTVEGKPLRELHLKVPFSKTFFTVDCDTGRRVMLVSRHEDTDPWTAAFAVMWRNADETVPDLSMPKSSWCGIRILVDAPDGQHEMLSILPHDITFESLRIHTPVSFLV
jgi:hypothetical protein